MSIEYKVIGRHIRTARKRKNMTQEDVAAAIEMSPAHFGKVERGDRPVNLQRLSQLSQVLDVPLEKLVEGAAIADDGSTVSKTGFTGNDVPPVWHECHENARAHQRHEPCCRYLHMRCLWNCRGAAGIHEAGLSSQLLGGVSARAPER